MSNRNSVSVFKEMLERLNAATKSCDEQMHEPDINAIVTGTHLANAMGDDPYHNCCEFTVGIGSEEDGYEWFNLSSLIALARVAKLPE